MDTIPAKVLLTRTKNSGWFGTEYNMNIYRGCTHGCIYCDSRSDCYRNADFGRVKAKENALRILRDNLRSKVRSGVVATGSMSDPYNPFEAEQRLTRHALELLNAYGFGVAIATKAALVARDIDILKEIKEHSPVLVKLTVTAADEELCKIIEPGAPASAQRFKALEALSQAGIYCGVLLMPVLPYINDSEDNMYKIVRQAAESGAKFVYPWFGLTMRGGQREYLYARLDESFPGIREKYEARYGNGYRCDCPGAKKLYEAFRRECGKTGLLYDMREIISGYRMGYEPMQLKFFE